MDLPVEARKEVETQLSFLSQRAAKEPNKQFHSIMHHVNKEALKANFYKLGRNRAVGVDGVSWREYETNLEKNIEQLFVKMKQMAYRPKAVRRVYIPKGKNGQRPLGIPAIEDKIVQKTMVDILEAIYEQDFYDYSYGFRRQKSCHQALKSVSMLINNNPIHHVIDADIKGFFDNVSHEKLVELLEKRITDKKFLRYVIRFLKSGCMEDGKIHKTNKGTPQGGNISPMLANIFLHYVLDEWFEKEIKPGLRGQSHIVRYCDDFVILVRYKDEAQAIMRKVKERFKEFGLELNEDKTEILSFGFFERENAKKQKRKANTFDFLGLTHYCSETRRGRFKVSRKTSKKRLNESLKSIGKWLKNNRCLLTIRALWEKLIPKIRGHYQYYGVSDNIRSLEKYNYEVTRLIYKWMNRRSQRQSFNWEQFDKYLKCYPLPKPKNYIQFLYLIDR